MAFRSKSQGNAVAFYVIAAAAIILLALSSPVWMAFLGIFMYDHKKHYSTILTGAAMLYFILDLTCLWLSRYFLWGRWSPSGYRRGWFGEDAWLVLWVLNSLACVLAGYWLYVYLENQKKQGKTGQASKKEPVKVSKETAKVEVPSVDAIKEEVLGSDQAEVEIPSMEKSESLNVIRINWAGEDVGVDEKVIVLIDGETEYVESLKKGFSIEYDHRNDPIIIEIKCGRSDTKLSIPIDPYKEYNLNLRFDELRSKFDDSYLLTEVE